MTEESHPAPDLRSSAVRVRRMLVCYFFGQQSSLRRRDSDPSSCIAGIGSGNQPMIRAAKLAGERVLIDGFPVGCGKKIMDANKVRIDRYLIVTELGIDKTHGLDTVECDIETVVNAIKNP